MVWGAEEGVGWVRPRSGQLWLKSRPCSQEERVEEGALTLGVGGDDQVRLSFLQQLSLVMIKLLIVTINQLHWRERLLRAQAQ